MYPLVTSFILVLSDPIILYLLVLLAALVVAGMSVYGMTQAVKKNRR